MSSCFRLLLITACLLITIGQISTAQDLGAPDTLYLIPSELSANGNDSLFVMEAWAFNDANDITLQFGFQWDSEQLKLDSVRPSPKVDSLYNMLVDVFKHDLDSANAYHLLYFVTIAIPQVGMPARPEPHLLVTYYFTVNDWTDESTISIDTTHWNDGSEMLFVSPDGWNNYHPVWQWRETGLTVRDVSRVPCCGLYTGGMTGNVDCSPGGERNLADVHCLIDHIYLSKVPLCCEQNGDIRSDGVHNLADIIMLIDHLYVSKQETAPCN